MRITYVTETFPPEINGVSLSVERALRHLQRVGHQVQLVRPQQRGGPPLHTADEWRTAGGPIPMYPELRSGLASAASFRTQWRAAGVPDLVHVATPGPLAWATLRAARAASIPASADFRTNFHDYSRHYGLGWLEPLVLTGLRRLHAMANTSFVPTPQLARQLHDQGFERLQVLGRGVDTKRFSPALRDPALRQAWNAEPAARVLLHVGRLAPEKNARHYASADAFLFPSQTDTFGNVTLEALASGLAVVAFDTAAAAVHVQDGVSGCLAPLPWCGSKAAAALSNADFVRAAARALLHAAPGSSLRLQAALAARRADWDSVLRSFEQSLQTVANAAPRTGWHAAVA